MIRLMLSQEEYLKLQAVCRYMYNVAISRTQCSIVFGSPRYFLWPRGEHHKDEVELDIMEYFSHLNAYREVQKVS